MMKAANTESTKMAKEILKPRTVYRLQQISGRMASSAP